MPRHGALGSLQRLEHREELIPNSRDDAVLHLRNEDKLINAHEKRIEPVRPGDVTANDKLLFSVNATVPIRELLPQSRFRDFILGE
jgi:hypothetical protein